MAILCNFYYELIYNRIRSILLNYDETKNYYFENRSIIFQFIYKIKNFDNKCSLCVLARVRIRPDLVIEKLNTLYYSDKKLETSIYYRPIPLKNSSAALEKYFGFFLEVKVIESTSLRILLLRILSKLIL